MLSATNAKKKPSKEYARDYEGMTGKFGNGNECKFNKGISKNVGSVFKIVNSLEIYEEYNIRMGNSNSKKWEKQRNFRKLTKLCLP